MADLIKEIEGEHLKEEIPDFRPGDTVRVGVKITEGTDEEQRTRIQPFEGVVIARSGGGLSESFTVRRVTHGVGVERTFPLHSPVVTGIEVIRQGSPRRAKLYYLRQRIGRRARVREDERTRGAATTQAQQAPAEAEHEQPQSEPEQ